MEEEEEDDDDADDNNDHHMLKIIQVIVKKNATKQSRSLGAYFCSFFALQKGLSVWRQGVIFF